MAKSKAKAKAKAKAINHLPAPQRGRQAGDTGKTRPVVRKKPFGRMNRIDRIGKPLLPGGEKVGMRGEVVFRLKAAS